MSAVNGMTPLYPFSAIVGQPQLKRALLLCAVDPSLGGVLIRGDKGTAKSTAARALTGVLPHIARVAGCAFNCLPGAAAACCPVCNADNASNTAQQTVSAAVPFVTLPLGATEDRVLGTLDLQRALKGEQNTLQPGLLAAAHRGILYIDEVNLLADHVVDVLLDVAAMGVNTIEREGLSVSHPARLTLIGTMNLEEGDLRPQLLDRFGLMVEVTAPREKQLRGEVVRRRLAYEADPVVFAANWETQQQDLRTQIAAAQAALAEVVLDDALLDLISHLCCEFEVASLRADIVMHKAARALAALDGRARVTPEDIRNAAELVLPHRRRRKPFEQAGLDQDKLDDLMQQHQQEDRQQDQPPPQSSQPEAQSEAGDQSSSDHNEAEQDGKPDNAGANEQVFHAVSAGAAPQIKVERASGQLSAVAGRRSEPADSGRGRTVRVVADSNPGHLAVAATVRSALLRSAAEESTVISLQSSDLHGKVKVGKAANLILFVVDASGSMAAQRRMEAVKGAVLDLLTNAYQRRDQVAVIGFRGEQASLLLAPTRSVDLAEQGLRELPTGGRTPLPHALQLALETLDIAARSNTSAPPVLVLLSDGKGNVALQSGNDPWRETLTLTEQLAARGIPALVIDTESGYVRLGRAAQLAQVLGAPCLTLEDLSADMLALTIRSSIKA
ncbi:magnesium chelatase subunit D [Herbaspirillum sp. Sphag1AN]|uniref:putative cobaltochelatase n=1 Tax=unclassified Herbaspirillum TaxID=2624150 RepID=UPI00183C8869|nr:MULTISPECIES: putative cobaltochelatase [unclassified Herbaspirillum]MBB3213154.1 magnesium chelatase subunit D [Herbaspirillum sp. Sphag1AN]MBB3246351.1 magnesium chelatase subunit D [Herbaspirillum sp. Sphag64]